MTANNHSGAAHDGARSHDKAPEGAPGGPAGEPFRGTEGFAGAEVAGEPEGAEVLHGTVVTWPGPAGDEAAAAEVTSQEPEPESGDLPLWDWSPPADRPAEGRSAEEPPAEREDPPKPEWKPVVTPVEEADPGPGRRRGTLSQLASHPRMRVWQLRALVAVIVLVVFSILVSWKLGLTLAVIVVIADTIYRARKGYARKGHASKGHASKVKLTAAQRHTRGQLTKLGRAGYRAMHASPIPDSEDQIDHLVVGPAGVFAIDSEDWDKRLIVRTKSGKQLYHGPFSKKDRLEHARWEAQRAADLLSGETGTQVAVHPAMAVYGPKVPWDVATIREVDVFSGPRLRKYLRRRARNRDVRPLSDEEIERIFKAADKAFPHLSSGSPAS
jgi:Nuclease-related domain